MIEGRSLFFIKSIDILVIGFVKNNTLVLGLLGSINLWGEFK